MRRMQLDVAVLQDFSAFLSSAAAGCLLFIFLGKHQLKLLHVKIFRFYKVGAVKPAQPRFSICLCFYEVSLQFVFSTSSNLKCSQEED